MQLRYTITLADYLEAQRLMTSGAVRKLRFLLLLITVACVGVVITNPLRASAPSSGSWLSNHWTPVLGAIFYAAILLLVPAINQWQARRLFRKAPPSQWEGSAELTPDHFLSQDVAGSSSSIAWSKFQSLQEGKRVFLLGTPQKVFTIIPKSQMAPDEESRVRAFLHSAIPAAKP